VKWEGNDVEAEWGRERDLARGCGLQSPRLGVPWAVKWVPKSQSQDQKWTPRQTFSERELMKGGNGELFAVRWAGSSGVASQKKRVGRIWSPKASCVDEILDCWFQCLNLVLCNSGTARGRPHIGLRAGAWCAKSLQDPSCQPTQP
jgi:hypothetical protein